MLSSSARRLTPEEDVDLLLDPLLVVRGVCIRAPLVYQTAEVRQPVYEFEQLAYVVCDAGNVGVLALEVLLVDLAHSLHAFVYRLVVGIRARLGLVPWLQ